MKEEESIKTVLYLGYCSSSVQMHGLVQHRHLIKQRMKDRISCSDLVHWLYVTSLVSIIFPHWPLALSLVLPGPVGLLAVLAAVGCVPAAPVYCLWFTLVTLETERKVELGDKRRPRWYSSVQTFLWLKFTWAPNWVDFRDVNFLQIRWKLDV